MSINKIVIRALSASAALLLLATTLSGIEAKDLGAQRHLLASTPAAAARDTIGVSDSEINIGSCCSLSGALAERGHQLALGAQSYLQSINQQGGVSGRRIKLTQCDDRYDPEAAISCFNSCLKNKVFLGAFFVGSPPISKYVRMAESSDMPLFGFCTGTPIIYEPHPEIFVLRRGYADEVSKQIKELYKTHGIRKIGIIYQNDPFGAAIRESAVKALSAFGVQPVVETSYSRRTQDIDDAYKALRQAHPQAVIVGATSAALKGLVKKKNDDHWNAIFMGLSVADDYVGELGNAADGIVLTQVVPLVDERSLPAVKLFDKLRSKYEPGAQATATAFEAFLNAIVLAEALKRCGHDVTRQNFVKAMQSIHNFDIGAGSQFKVSFSLTNHVGWPPDSVYFTIVKNGTPVPMQEADWKPLVKSVKAGT